MSRVNELPTYRDDGWCSLFLGRFTAGALPPLLPALAGMVVTGVLVLAGLATLPGLTLFAPVIALLFAGVGSSSPHDGRLDWLVPPLLRVTEYLFIAALGLGAGVASPLVYALLGAIIFHHYDLVYRTRQGNRPPEWLTRAALGWDGRMLLIALAGLFGWLPFAYGVLAGYLWLLFAWESTTSWLATPRDGTKAVDLEEEAV